MNVALVLNSKVAQVMTLDDATAESQIQALSEKYEQVIDLTGMNPQPQVGWTFHVSKLTPPPSTDPTTNIINHILQPAINFGNQLILQFAAENIAMGITQAGKTIAVTEATGPLPGYLSTGSLYAALTAISQIQVPSDGSLSPFLTQARLNIYANYIRAYLGLPPI